MKDRASEVRVEEEGLRKRKVVVVMIGNLKCINQLAGRLLSSSTFVSRGGFLNRKISLKSLYNFQSVYNDAHTRLRLRNFHPTQR